MENQASEGILKSLDNKLDKMKDQIIQEGKEKARLIDEEAQKKLLQLKNKDKQLIESSDMIISIKQDLMTKKREWMAKFNSKRAQLVTKAFDTTKNQISQLHTRNKSFYSQLLVTLFLEVVDQIPQLHDFLLNGSFFS